MVLLATSRDNSVMFLKIMRLKCDEIKGVWRRTLKPSNHKEFSWKD